MRSMPGFRGKPAVTTTTSAPRMTSILSEPSMRASKWNTGPACVMSSALPAGTPGRMSYSATSAMSFDAICHAAVAPTLPPPMIATLRMVGFLVRAGTGRASREG